MKHLFQHILNSLNIRFGWFFYNGRKIDRWERSISKKFPFREPKRLAVTGAAGFIGSHLTKLLVKKGYKVTVVDSLTYAGDYGNIKDLDIEFQRVDITDKKELNKLFGSRTFDAIIHLAAESHVDRSIENPLAFVQTNVNGTVNLLEEAVKQHEKNPNFVFYHVSTDEVFGTLPLFSLDRFSEDTPYDPRSPYSASKASSDHFVRAYHHTYDLPVLISNCSNNYGTHQYPEKLIPVVIEKLMKREPIPVYGQGVNKRDWLHVEDHADAIHTILQRGISGETYCVGGNNVVSNINLVYKLCSLFDEMYGFQDSRNLIKYVKDRKGHDLKYAINPSKIRFMLGWKPKKNFNEGLRETIQWYVEEKFGGFPANLHPKTHKA